MDATLAGATMNQHASERSRSAFAAYGPRIRAFVRRRIGDLAEADDLVQEVFEELARAAREPIDEVAAWLMRVARNRIIDRYRARAREARVLDRSRPLEGAAGEDEPSLLESLRAPAAEGPEAAWLRARLLEELQAALEELPEAQRAVFVAHELEGRTFRELAAESGEPINTLLGRKHEAVRRLRARLQPYNDLFPL